MSTSRHLAIASTLLGTMIFVAASVATGAPPPAAPTPAAAAPAKAKVRTAQQQRMADCSHQAKTDGKKGAERRTFMSSCLKGKAAAAPAGAKAKGKAPPPSADGNPH